MTAEARREMFDKTVALLKPAFERVVKDPEYRQRLERDPLAALSELGVTLDETTRAELAGKTFSEFWAGRRAAVEGPVQIRDLPPAESGALDEEQLGSVTGGAISAFVLGKGPIPSFAPPYVPVMPVSEGDSFAFDSLASDRLRKK